MSYHVRNFLKFPRNYSKLALKQDKDGRLIISTKRSEYNHYSGTIYNKFDEVPLVSKGWNHSKSKGDYFTIHPDPNVYDAYFTSTFEQLKVHPNIIDVLRNQSINEVTRFQSEAIPAISSGKHALIAAETGCGKTLAYLLPIIKKLLLGKRIEQMNTPRVVILVPNRELAHQIGSVAELLAKAVDLTVKVIVGGHTKRIMMNPEFSELDILVATPGALGKLATVGIYKLDMVQHAVLDEADTLLDDSFIDRLTGFLKRLTQSQLILVSATLPKKLPDILTAFEEGMLYVTSENLHKPLLNITQKFIRLTRSAKPSQILQIAKSTKSPLLVFTNRNTSCNWLAMFLRENGLKCSNINGDMNYEIRINQWNDFVNNRTNILSATDIGSRGLDTTQIKHVVNYDFPLYAADYIHRIGRTGRLGSPEFCKVTNFVSGPEEFKLVQQIELAVRKNEALPNVDGNITNIVQRKILRRARDSG